MRFWVAKQSSLLRAGLLTLPRSMDESNYGGSRFIGQSWSMDLSHVARQLHNHSYHGEQHAICDEPNRVTDPPRTPAVSPPVPPRLATSDPALVPGRIITRAATHAAGLDVRPRRRVSITMNQTSLSPMESAVARVMTERPAPNIDHMKRISHHSRPRTLVTGT